ncbi:MAG: MarR family transcriptional regulator [Gemmatimonadaceae bacterium]
MTAKRTRQAKAEREHAVDALRGIVASLHQSARAVERTTGATNAQVFVLQQLARESGLCVRDVAECAKTSESATSLIVARLVRSGLVRKARSAVDARAVVLTLTPAGRRVVDRSPPPATTRLLEAVETLSPSEAGALAQGLDALVRALGLVLETAPLLFEIESAEVSAAAHPTRRSAV